MLLIKPNCYSCSKSLLILIIPFFVSCNKEARGKEGQLGYHIIQKDTSAKIYISGFIGILHGNPIGETDDEGWDKIASARSPFLGREITWNIYKTPTGFFDAETPRGEDVSGHCTSNKRNEIDTLISVIATLTEK